MKKVLIVIGLLFCVLGNAQGYSRLPEATKNDSVVMWRSDTKLTHAKLSDFAGWINDAITGGASDNQQLSLSGNVLSLQNGGSVDLTLILGSNQVVETFSFDTGTNIFTFKLSDDTIKTIDLSSLAGGGTGTDNQQLTRSGDIITLENGGTIDISDKQESLVSGTNIKTINSQSILGFGNIDIATPPVSTGWEQSGTTTYTNQDLVSINNGKLLIDGVNENSIVYKRSGTIGTGNHIDPIFETGRIVGTGIGEPTWRILYRDSGSDTNEYNSGESLLFAVEPSGTVASVRRKVGSHFEGFIDGESEPFFRIESIDLDAGVGVTPSTRIRMGAGGVSANDVELIRRGDNQLSLALGGGNKWTTYADSFQLESGITQNFINTPATPTTPASGVVKVYNKGGIMMQLDETGTETPLNASGGGGISQETNLFNTGEIFTGYGIRVQSNTIQAEANYNCVVIELEPNTDYVVSGLTSTSIHKSAFVKKTGSDGTALDYVKLIATEGYQETNLNLNPNTETVYFKFTSPVIVDETIGKLYILINIKYLATDATGTINVRKVENYVDNVKYAIEQENPPTVNLFDKNNYWNTIGIIYNSFNPPSYNKDYSASAPIPVDKNEFYSFSGHTLSESGNTGVRRIVFCKKTVSGYVPLTNTEAGGTYIHGTAGNLAFVNLNSEFPDLPAFTLKTPDAAIGTDQLYMIVNLRYLNVSSVETLQIEKGTSITAYTPKNVLSNFLGFEVPSGSTNSGGSSTTQWTNKNITFAGDSLVFGTNGSFIDVITSIIGCIKSNLGSAGAAADRLVGILTPIKDRNANSPTETPDYTAIDAVMIMIGTNGLINGTSADIPAGTYEAAADKTAYLNSFANTFYGNVAMCVEYIKAMNPATKIYIVTPPHENGTDKTIVRDILKEISEYYSTVFINAIDNAGIDKKNFDRYSPDGTHFTAQGNEIWGNYIGYQMLNN